MVRCASGAMNTRRVHENHLAFFGCLDSKNSIACGLRFVADNGHLLSDQLIEKGGFTNVGTANEGNET